MLKLSKETKTRSITGFFIMIFVLAFISLKNEWFTYVGIVLMTAVVLEWFSLWYKRLLGSNRADIVLCALGLVYIISTLYMGLSFSKTIDDRGLLILMLAASDAGAYFVGRSYGKHKIAPNISPGKTWEGLLGGVATTTILGGLYVYFVADFQLTYWLLPFVSVVAHIGDFLQSAVKRYLQIKGTGKILPGHGGLLDRLDSSFTVIPFYYGLMIHLW